MIIGLKAIKKIEKTNHLNKVEMELISGYGSVKRQLESTTSLFMLDLMLKEKGLAEYQIERGSNGKPYLKDQNLFYNISHSSEYAACAISSEEVGIDIEKISNRARKVAPRFLCPVMKKKDEKKPYENKDLTTYWAIKESFTKMLGRGLTIPFNKISIIYKKEYYIAKYEKEKGFVRVYDYNGYIVAVSQRTKEHLKEPITIY